MAKSNKYDYQLTQNNSNWSAEIIRRVSRKKNIISKSQQGFASETDARKWAENELEIFMKNLKARNQRHSSQRQQKAARIQDKAKANSPSTLS